MRILLACLALLALGSYAAASGPPDLVLVWQATALPSRGTVVAPITTTTISDASSSVACSVDEALSLITSMWVFHTKPSVQQGERNIDEWMYALVPLPDGLRPTAPCVDLPAYLVPLTSSHQQVPASTLNCDQLQSFMRRYADEPRLEKPMRAWMAGGNWAMCYQDRTLQYRTLLVEVPGALPAVSMPGLAMEMHALPDSSLLLVLERRPGRTALEMLDKDRKVKWATEATGNTEYSSVLVSADARYISFDVSIADPQRLNDPIYIERRFLCTDDGATVHQAILQSASLGAWQDRDRMLLAGLDSCLAMYDSRDFLHPRHMVTLRRSQRILSAALDGVRNLIAFEEGGPQGSWLCLADSTDHMICRKTITQWANSISFMAPNLLLTNDISNGSGASVYEVR